MTLRPLQIAAGAMVGALIGGAAVHQMGPESIERALAAASSSFRQLTRTEAPAAAPNGKATQREAAEQAQAKTVRDEQARQLRADQQRASGGAAGSEALEVAARKERAWNRFYKKPSQCDGNPSSEVMTECANHYIRAKRQFEDAYAAGKL